MKALYSLKLNENDLGQIIDGLEARAAAWEKTEEYLRTNNSPRDFIVEECNNADEARSLARNYRSIIANITNQRNAQS